MREKTYEILVGQMNRFISGETLSDKLGVSRAAILKHIQIFREDGAKIDSVNNKGHKLEAYADRLKPEYVTPLLQTRDVFTFYWKESLDSTNNTAKALAVSGMPHFTCVTAEQQTGGRGRMGRVWTSPKYKGIYATLILRPGIPAEKSLGITVLAALAVTETLRKYGLPASIKWPNDVLIHGKKICGILTEISASMDGVEYIVCGIGINANMDETEFPDELKEVATSMRLETGELVQRTKILADMLDAFYRLYGIFMQDGVGALIGRYTEYSALHGREVTLIFAKGEEKGIFYGFDEEAALLVKQDGIIKRYIAGEISLRGF